MHDSPEGRTLARVRRSFRKLAWCLAGTARGWLWLAALGPAWPAGFAAAADPSVAFYYGPRPPLDELKAFDIAVVEPDHVPDPRPHARPAERGTHELFAYVSIGEVDPSRAYFRDLPRGVLKGENRAWGSSVVDQTAPAWPAFLADRIIAPLWQRGYRGFFLDTLDSYHLIAPTAEQRAAQEAALVATLRGLRERFPGMRLIANRGFEILPQVKDMVLAVAAESLYRGWDPVKRAYRDVPAADHDWLLGQLGRAKRELGLAAIAIDYVAPGQRERARETARRIAADGLIPWVANPELDMLGVGRLEVLPRRVLVLTERPEDSGDFHTSTAQRFLGMPLNHLGYAYEFVDPRTEPLPAATLAGRYAGVVAWLAPSTQAVNARVATFLERAQAEGVRIAVFNLFPHPLDARGLRRLGLAEVAAPTGARLSIASRDPMVGFEREPLPSRRELAALRISGAGRSLLQLVDGGGQRYDAAAVMPWGAYVLSPFTFVALGVKEQTRWVINPVEFLKAAFARDRTPVPDVTTEAGRRMLLVHVDGDGWASRAEMPGAPYASEVMARELLERYRVPTTVSVIQGEIAADGLYPKQSDALESVARRIFRLPHVDPASHSFSHPFDWSLVDAPDVPGETSYHLKIPGYRFDLAREVGGSVDYINQRLAPPDKPARIFLWTGNCVPLPGALEATVRGGLLNMNGGDTLITRSFPSWTAVAAQGIRKAGLYQVFAPMQNENVYTNNWTGPFYGHERLIETIELTGAPLRVKPINIYYHTYAASKPASLAALRKIYDYALAQEVAPVRVADYIAKVLDFEGMVLAREIESGDLRVRGAGALATLRLDDDAPVPDLMRSEGLAGIAPGPRARYLTLAAAEARLSWRDAAPRPAHLRDANGAVSELARDASGFSFTLTSHVAPTFRLAGAESCGVSVNGKALRSTRSESPPGEPGTTLQRYDPDPAGIGRAPHRQVVRVRCVQ